MISFKVEDMTCGGCASSVTRAVQIADAAAKVDIDLAQHLVRITPAKASAQQLEAAIREAGFTPAAMG